MNHEHWNQTTTLPPAISQEYKKSLRTGVEHRDYKEYLRVFRLGKRGEALHNKQVLEVGAGDNDLAQKIKQLGVACSIVQVDPTYSKNRQPAYPDLPVTGVVQALPFKENSFDMVLASWVMRWIYTYQDQAIEEMLRVTKPGQPINIYPVYSATPDNSPQPTRHSRLYGTAIKTLEIRKDASVTPKEWRREVGWLIRKVRFEDPRFGNDRERLKNLAHP